MKAIIPVAGAGIRLRPHTFTQPKALIPVAGKPILGFIIDQLIDADIADFVFVIGGSLGLHKKVVDRANFKLSFSKMTFPHQMMKLILLEQIYRSFRIIQNAPYHK